MTPMSMKEAELARDLLIERLGRMPSTDEIIAQAAVHRGEEEDRRREEERNWVGVQFPGNRQIYTYRVKSGPQVQIGDYLKVWSPRTECVELVRVARLGRGDWPYEAKYAYRIEHMAFEDGSGVAILRGSEDYDPFRGSDI